MRKEVVELATERVECDVHEPCLRSGLTARLHERCNIQKMGAIQVSLMSDLSAVDLMTAQTELVDFVANLGRQTQKRRLNLVVVRAAWVLDVIFTKRGRGRVESVVVHFGVSG